MEVNGKLKWIGFQNKKGIYIYIHTHTVYTKMYLKYIYFMLQYIYIKNLQLYFLVY